MSPLFHRSNFIRTLGIFFILFSGLGVSTVTHAEYGDVVLNNFADDSGVRPVVFPHWFHRIRFSCKICHSDLGFQMKAGASKINMLKIINGEYCGACHNGQTAWGVENCELCHSAKAKIPTEVDKGPVVVFPRYGKK